MFEITQLDIMITTGSGYRSCAVYKFEDRLFFKVGTTFYRIKRNGSTGSPKITWIKFSQDYNPQFDSVGWAEAGFL